MKWNISVATFLIFTLAFRSLVQQRNKNKRARCISVDNRNSFEIREACCFLSDVATPIYIRNVTCSCRWEFFSSRSLAIPSPHVLLSVKFSSQVDFQCPPWQMSTCLRQRVAEQHVPYGMISGGQLRHFWSGWRHLSFSEWQFLSLAACSECLPKKLVLFHWTPKLVTCCRWYEQFHHLTIFTFSRNFRCIEVKKAFPFASVSIQASRVSQRCQGRLSSQEHCGTGL